jgi:hypothetical protein
VPESWHSPRSRSAPAAAAPARLAEQYDGNLPSRFPGTWNFARRVRKLPDASAWIEIRTRPEQIGD